MFGSVDALFVSDDKGCPNIVLIHVFDDVCDCTLAFERRYSNIDHLWLLNQK